MSGALFDSELGIDAGAAYLFLKQQNGFVEFQKLFGTDQEAGDWFGYALAIDDDSVMVNSLQHVHNESTCNGAVYVFTQVDGQWSEIQELCASDGVIGDGFGAAIAIDGDIALIGAWGDDDNGFTSGSAYIFYYNGAQWHEEQKLLASDGESGDFFGEAVALLGDVALIGANGDDSLGFASETGAAYVFRFDGSDWIEEQKIVPADVLNQDRFGESVALGPGIAMIGSPYDHSDPAHAGAVYVFTFDGKKWVQAQEILPPPEHGPAKFGDAIALDGDLALISAWAGNPPVSGIGAAYLYKFDGTSWDYQQTFLPEPNSTTSFFGYAVDIDDGLAVVSAHGETNQSGAVYIFDVDPTPADLDCDGLVGPADLAELLAQWGACAAKGECSADIAPPPTSGGGDGIVNPADLAELLAMWGS